MILFATPDVARPSGGVRTIYRAVDLLNDAGLEAAVLHTRAGFRCTWFSNSTRIEHPPVTVGGDDVVVVPEAFTPDDLDRLAPGVAKVVFNQNAYRTFASARRDGRVVATTAEHPDVVRVLVVSEDNRSLLARTFPHMDVARMHHWIDESVFRPDPTGRERRIVAMPRKRPGEFRLLVDLLGTHGALDGWEIRPIEGRSEEETAAELGRAALFVALGRDEGFGLPVAEALASACPVVGFHGMGGRELFCSDFAVPVEDGDVGALADAVTQFVAGYDDEREAWERRGREAVAFVRSRYSREQATRDLVACFGTIRPRLGVAATTIVRHDLPGRGLATRARTRAVRLGRRLASSRAR